MKNGRRRHSGSAKSKKKILYRIVFVIVAAAAITALTILLGTHLKHKADSVGPAPDQTESEPSGGGREEKTLPDGVKAQKGDGTVSVCAADLDISSVSENDLINRILSLPDFYSAVSIRVTRDGTLVYGSPAVAALTREASPEHTDPDEVGASLVAIADLVSVAKGRGLPVSVIYETTPEVFGDGDASVIAKTVDLAVIGELSGIGTDEILIDGLISDDRTLDFDALSDIIVYLAALRSESGETSLGVVLPARVFLDPPTAAQIVTLCDYTDVTAIGIDVAEPTTEDGAYYSVGSDCYPLKGSFGTYNLRAVIKAYGETSSRGAYRALTEMGVENIQFSAYFADPTPPSAETEFEQETEEPPIEERTNENAVTADNPPAEGQTDGETDEEAGEESSAAATEWGAAAVPGG